MFVYKLRCMYSNIQARALSSLEKHGIRFPAKYLAMGIKSELSQARKEHRIRFPARYLAVGIKSELSQAWKELFMQLPHGRPNFQSPRRETAPAPPLLRRSAPPKVPGLPAASSGGTPRASKGRQPLDFPLSSQCRRWSEWNSEGSNAKITPKFKLLCRNDCILLSVERPSLVAM